jgi:hypothetical protein
MKKLILSALIMGSAAVAANAQAGSILVYGNIGYHSTKDNDDSKTRSFNINPGVGYQFDKNWTVGLTGSFSTARTLSNVPNSEWNFTNTYSAGVFLRHTMPLGKIFSLYSQIQAEYIGTTDGISNTPGSSLTANGFRASFIPAIGVNVWNGFALNFSFGGVDYTTLKTSGVSGSAQAFNFTWGTQVNVGVSRNIFCGHHKHHGHHGMKMNHGSSVDQQDMKDDNEDK